MTSDHGYRISFMAVSEDTTQPIPLVSADRWLVVVARHFRDGDEITAYDTRAEAEAAYNEAVNDPDQEGAAYTAEVYLCRIVAETEIRSHF